MAIVKDLAATVFGGETSGEKAAREAAGIQAGAATSAAQVQAEASAAASAAQKEALERALAQQAEQFRITQEQAEPFRQAELKALARGAPLRRRQTALGLSQTEAAQQALQQRRALTGLAGAEAQQEAMSGLEASPAQQFMRERQQKALLRNQAALGGLGGGQVLSELQQQAAGFASQDLQSQLARLSSFGGSGMTGQVSPQVAQQLGIQRGGFAGQAGQFLQAGGQAQAQGLLGAGQARAGGLLGAGQAQASGILGGQQARAGLQGQLLGAGIGAGLGGAGLLGEDIGAGGGALLGLL